MMIYYLVEKGFAMSYVPFLQQREDYIIYLLEKRGQITIHELCHIFNVGPSTIRKELASMEKKGVLLRTYGGAASIKNVHGDTLTLRMKQNVADKIGIARQACKLIDDGDLFAVGSGSTTLELSRCLIHLKSGTVITNSVPAASVLTQNEALEVRIYSGIVDQRTGGIVGTNVDDYFACNQVKKVFLGAEALNSKDGATESNILIARVERNMVKHAKQIIFLCDHTKIGQSGVGALASIHEIDVVVTDQKADPHEVEALQSCGVKVIIAEQG